MKQLKCYSYILIKKIACRERGDAGKERGRENREIKMDRKGTERTEETQRGVREREGKRMK